MWTNNYVAIIHYKVSQSWKEFLLKLSVQASRPTSLPWIYIYSNMVDSAMKTWRGLSQPFWVITCFSFWLVFTLFVHYRAHCDNSRKQPCIKIWNLTFLEAKECCRNFIYSVTNIPQGYPTFTWMPWQCNQEVIRGLITGNT